MYIFKVLNSPTVAAPGTLTHTKQMSFDDAVAANRPFPPIVKEHLRSTYAHLAGGLAMTGTFAYMFHRSGWSRRMLTSKYSYLKLH